METLEIELSYIQRLVDEEVARVVRQFAHWEMLEDCSSVFDLDVSHIKDPMRALSDLIKRKADEHLSQDQAQMFKAAWEQTQLNDQIYIVLSVVENA
jgi:hypothetical protein